MTGRITVANGYHVGFNSGVYIGRAGKGKAGSPLANPFRVDSYGRSYCLKQYREWLLKQVEDPTSPQSVELVRLVNLLLDGRDIMLICFCKPKDCHGDIIKELIELTLAELPHSVITPNN